MAGCLCFSDLSASTPISDMGILLLKSIRICATLQDRSHTRIRWPKQNKLKGILIDRLFHVALFHHFFFVLTGFLLI